MYRVMLRDNMSPRAKEILEATGQIQVVVDNDKATNDPKVLAGLIGEYDGLGVRSGTKVTAAVLEKAAKLKVVARAGIGVDNVDVGEASSRGIVVMNAPGGNTLTTAEHAVSMMLSLARNIPQATSSMRAGLWEKKAFMGVEIGGKTLGIIGLGQIGRVVASRAQGLGMKVIATDPYITKEVAASLGVELVFMEDLLADADFISLHVPRLEETKNLIRSTTLQKMKKGVRLINCARGDIVNLDDLAEALSKGHVAGAALDVFPQEPPDFSAPIFKHPNVILTPHLGASTGEAQEKVAEMIAKQMVSYLLEGVIINAVNFPSIPMETMAKLRLHLDLAEQMGSMVGQTVRHPCDVNITYSGYVTEFDTRVLTHAALKGLLSCFTDRPVNFVNAPYMAKAKGIKVQETIQLQAAEYTNLIRIDLPGIKDDLNELWGTVFAKKYPRIVRIGKIFLDAIPQGPMILVQNVDRPGVIGNIGMTLGKHGVNIARFQLGRTKDKEQAICTVNLDTPVSDDILHEIRALPAVMSVHYIKFGA
ncbi:MAG: phosphoglycerate dehydrogenase [Deltaproteobacteria bacterium]